MAHIPLPDGLPGIRGPMAFRPETAKPLNELANILLHGPHSLTPGERELIATFVSAENECRFCQTRGIDSAPLLLEFHEAHRPCVDLREEGRLRIGYFFGHETRAWLAFSGQEEIAKMGIGFDREVALQRALQIVGARNVGNTAAHQQGDGGAQELRVRTDAGAE